MILRPWIELFAKNKHHSRHRQTSSTRPSVRDVMQADPLHKEFISFHFISFSFHFISFHFMSCHFIHSFIQSFSHSLSHVMSCHVMSLIFVHLLTPWLCFCWQTFLPMVGPFWRVTKVSIQGKCSQTVLGAMRWLGESKATSPMPHTPRIRPY